MVGGGDDFHRFVREFPELEQAGRVRRHLDSAAAGLPQVQGGAHRVIVLIDGDAPEGPAPPQRHDSIHGHPCRLAEVRQVITVAGTVDQEGVRLIGREALELEPAVRVGADHVRACLVS